MTFSGMSLEQFNTNKAAITTEVANNLGKPAKDVTLTPKSETIRRRMTGNLILKLAIYLVSHLFFSFDTSKNK